MYLFSMYVHNEYTARQLEGAAHRLGHNMKYQWVKKGLKFIVACDFYSI